MKNIVIPDGHTLNPGDLSWTPIQQLGNVSIYPHTPQSLLVNRCFEATVILPNKVIIDAAIMDQLPQLEYIGISATGTNNVDLEAARERGIVVTNVKGYGSAAVAQHVFALLLALTNKVKEHHQSVLEGQWARAKHFCYWNYPLVELAGKKMGIIGYGKIGKAVAQIAQAFGMSLLINHKYPIEETADMRAVNLDVLFRESDVISLHLPLTDFNHEFVDKNYLNIMKPTAYLINTSRGGLIQEDDLCEALLKEKIAGAAVDVLSEEPPKRGNVLMGAPNCIVTPHLAWATKEARQRLLHMLAQNVATWLKGQPLNVVT